MTAHKKYASKKMSIQTVNFERLAGGSEQEKNLLLDHCNKFKNTNCPCEGIASTSKSYPSGFPMSTNGDGDGPGCLKTITGRNLTSSSEKHAECLLASMCAYYFPDEMKGAPAYTCSNSQACRYNSVPEYVPHDSSVKIECDIWDEDCMNQS